MSGGRKLAFIVTEDWFFASHFLPMIAAAVRAGFEPVVITRVRNHARAIEATGARVIAFEANRRSLNPFAVVASIVRLSSILRREGVDRVHLIALRSIIVGGLAASLAGISRRIFAVTGGGVLTARTDFVGRWSSRLLVGFVRRGLETATTQYLFENADDPVSFGLRPNDLRVTIVGGAGVDPDYFQPSPLQDLPPLKVAVVARMVWSKGIDLAVEAVSRARAKGIDVELSLYGAPDGQNPKSIPETTLRAWSALDGVSWMGVSSDVRDVWRMHHVACLPSRGGEGLPRTLLEAAACGRALVTTDVPGCRSFVRSGVDGIVVPPDDISALEDAFIDLAENVERLQSFGQSARLRVQEGFTEKAVVDATAQMYRSWDR